MALRFTIRSADLKRLRNALDAHRCLEEGQHWMVYLEVVPSIAEFRFGDQRIQYPIDGKSTGYARLPDFCIREATHWFLDRKPQEEFEVSVGHGWLYCGETSSHLEIEVGYLKDSCTGRVLYTSDAELMALGQMLSDASVLHAEMPLHIKDANDSIMASIHRAAAELRRRGVMEDEVEAEVYIQVLVHEKLEALKPTLRERFDTLGITLWKN
jgi:hypothetical protein